MISLLSGDSNKDLVELSLGSIGCHFASVAATSPQAVKHWTQTLILAPILHAAACALPKLGILALFLRIFCQKKYRVSCFALMSLVVALAMANIIAGASDCMPLAILWNRIEHGHCATVIKYFQWSTLPDVAVDLGIIVLPMPVVWKLNTSRQTKIGLTITFITGGL